MKFYLTILTFLFVVPVVCFSANTDVVMSESAVITVGGINVTVSGTANFDSIVVNADNFVVSLSKGSALTIVSSDRRDLSASPTQYRESFTCGTSESTAVISNSYESDTATVTVTPSSSACITPGGGGGGGGGGGSSVPTPVLVTIPGTTEEDEEEIITEEVISVDTTVSAIFSRTMRMGMSGADIKRLQQLLNSDSDTMIASSGVGSPGNETEYFGSLTKKAVQKFQAKYGIVSSGDEGTTGYGLVGPSTRAKLAEVFAEGVSTSETTTTLAGQAEQPVVSASAVFTSGMEKGMSGADTKRLQQLLNSDSDTMIASSGVGSPGNETEYFGSLTEKAVQKFQAKYGVATVGDAGYGYVGPKTRAKLAEVFGGQETSEMSGELEIQLENQIQQLLEQINSLQIELNEMM